jgi:UbiD family decarboxylase
VIQLRHLPSFREFIDELEKIGEIQQIDREVDWDLELGAVARRSYELRAPAPLFNSIKGIEPGFRVLAAPGGLSAQPGQTHCRIALALGLAPDTEGTEIVRRLAAARKRPPVPPRVVAAGPCKENVLTGEDVDLLRLPTPLIHQGDGGRYLQTYGLNVAKTPDGSWTNWSVNRMMLVDRNRLTCLIPPTQHFGIIKGQWQERGSSMPVAVVFGGDPGLPYVGGMPVPQNVDESHFLGAYFGEPLEMVRAETVDLLVPASAEIVIEGHVSHTDGELEGPMGEYPGYLERATAAIRPVLHVSAITYRNDPILPVAVAGAPVEEDHTVSGLPIAAEMTYLLQEAGLPVTICWCVLESAAHWWVVAVDLDWHEQTGMLAGEFARQIGEIVFGTKMGFGVPKLLLIENDIDVTDPRQVIWAFASRAHPLHGAVHFAGQPSGNLFVYLDAVEKMTYHVNKVVYNCLLADRFLPDERPVAADFAHCWPDALQRQVVENWSSYGYR